MAQDHWRKVEKAQQRLVLCRLMIDIMRTIHRAYVPAGEPFGVRLETGFIGLCIAGRYYLREKIFNSLIGMGSYQQARRILNRATAELAILDMLAE